MLLFLLAFIMFGCTTIQPAIKENRPLEVNFFPNERFDRVLQKYVNERGLVDYSYKVRFIPYDWRLNDQKS